MTLSFFGKAGHSVFTKPQTVGQVLMDTIQNQPLGKPASFQCSTKTKLNLLKTCYEGSKLGFQWSNHCITPQYGSKVVGYLNCHSRKKMQDKEAEIVLANTDRLAR